MHTLMADDGFPMSTVKAQWTGTMQLTGSQFAGITSTGASRSGSDVCVFSTMGTTVSTIPNNSPFCDSFSANTNESQRRISAALQIMYTGRADAASGLLRIGTGGCRTDYDNSVEWQTAAAPAAIYAYLGSDEDVIEVPVSALVGKTLTVLPKPLSRRCLDFETVPVDCPRPIESANTTLKWEEIIFACSGADSSSSFVVRWVENVEALAGSNSPYKSFLSPSPRRALPGASTLGTFAAYAAALARSIGAHVENGNFGRVITALQSIGSQTDYYALAASA